MHDSKYVQYDDELCSYRLAVQNFAGLWPQFLTTRIRAAISDPESSMLISHVQVDAASEEWERITGKTVNCIDSNFNEKLRFENDCKL